MNSRQHILLTGATGYIGRHLLSGLLHAGHLVSVIVRRKKGVLEERVLGLFSDAGARWAGRLSIYEGDITAPACGLDGHDMRRLRLQRLDVMLHGAGLTRFDAHLADEIRAHNVGGTQHAFSLCESLSIAEFQFLSTAFVAGDHPGRFSSADLDCGQGFRNPYEQSKFDAEVWLRKSDSGSGVRTTIHRPSIVVGGQVVGEDNTVNTVYTFLKTLHFIRECCRLELNKGGGRFSRLGIHRNGDDIFIPLRVAADPRVRVNLVSIGHVVEAIVRSIDPSELDGCVQHIIGDRTFSLEEFRRAFCMEMQIAGPLYVREEVFLEKNRNALEERYSRMTKCYAPYMYSAPRFVADKNGTSRRQPGAYGIDLQRLARNFIHQLADRGSGSGVANLGAMALECMHVDTPDRYFHRLVQKDIGGGFLRNNRFVDATIRFIVKNGQQTYDRRVCFRGGNARFVSGNVRADCCYEMDEDTFRRITNGWLDAKHAFFKGLIDISGNKETGLKFAHLLSTYYCDIDDHVIDELTQLS